MADEEKQKLAQAKIDSLVVRCQDGDKEAFSELYDLIVDQIYKYVYFRVSSQDAEDLTEMIFLKVFENIKQYRKDKFPFLSWVYRIAHNAVVDHYRVHRSLIELSPDFPEERKDREPRFSTETLLNKEILKKAMDKINKTYQQILILKFINGLSNDEVADAMNKRRGSIRILQFRALAALKKILVGMGIKEP